MWKAKAVALGLVLMMLSGCSEQVKNTSEALLYTGDGKVIKEEQIETTKVKKKTYKQETFANAKLYYTKQISVIMDVENAIIKSVKKEVGDKVKKGDLIATYKVYLSKSQIEREKLEIINERNLYMASYKSLQNQIIEKERIIKNMKDGEQREVINFELKKLKEQLKQKKAEEAAIVQKEKELAKTISDSKKTKLYSKYSGIVTKVLSSDEYENSAMGIEILSLRTENDFLVEIENPQDSLRYNSQVTIALGGDRNDIRHRLKGKVISAGNLSDKSSEDSEGGSSIFIRVSKADREKYDFTANNIYVEYEKINVKDCLVVEKDAIYTEVQGNDTAYYVYLVINGKMFQRYIQRALQNPELEQEEWILQGIEEGQELAKNVSITR